MRLFSDRWQPLVSVTVALVVVLGAGTREYIIDFGAELLTLVTADTDGTQLQSIKLREAHDAMHSLGLAETRQAITTLERMSEYDLYWEPSETIAINLALAELLLLQVLSTKLAMVVEPTSIELSIAAGADISKAQELVDQVLLIGVAGRSVQTQRAFRKVETLLFLAREDQGTNLFARASSPELYSLIYGSSLWRDPARPVPSGLITALRVLPTPSTLHRSLLALALLRSGDPQAAREVVDRVRSIVSDMRAANALYRFLNKQQDSRR